MAKYFNPIIIATFFVATLTALGLSINLLYIVAIPIGLTVPIFVAAALNGAPQRA